MYVFSLGFYGYWFSLKPPFYYAGKAHIYVFDVVLVASWFSPSGLGPLWIFPFA